MTRVRGALGLAAAALLALPSPAAPTPPGRNGLIAFAVYGSGIAVVRPDGRGLRKLTKGRRDHFPAWSPDGRRLAFQRAGDIYVIHADGSGLVRLTQGRAADGQPAWSPDGRLIAFIRGGDLWLMQPDGSRPRALYVAGRANGPSWSPDGLRIAVGLATDGDRGSIVVIARSGGNVRYITDGRFEPDGDAVRGAGRRPAAGLVAQRDADRVHEEGLALSALRPERGVLREAERLGRALGDDGYELHSVGAVVVTGRHALRRDDQRRRRIVHRRRHARQEPRHAGYGARLAAAAAPWTRTG
jgi:hypothetical protein